MLTANKLVPSSRLHVPSTLLPRRETFFVPGRVCLVGEHSDWAGGLRSSHPALAVGHAVVACTLEGLTVSATRRSDEALVLSSAIGGALTLEPEALLSAARGQSPWRYAAGVAFVLQDRWGVAGADVSIESNLPAAKGLSSSAALCVGVARAFNKLYGLQLTTAGEMDVAYAGERLTGSMCGRMDQCVALGAGAVAVMTFDGEVTTHSIVPAPAAPVWIVFADLAASKDTTIILRDMQAAVTGGETPEGQRLIDALGARNETIAKSVAEALADGDSKRLGALYTEAQQVFDVCAMPVCPDQLTAPRLHEVMSLPELQPYIYGAKGVGSQGDGTVQFVARGEAEAQELIFKLQSLGMPSAHLLQLGKVAAPGGTDTATDDSAALAALPVQRRVTTAVITAAGFGTRLFPASRSIRPKSLMPIIDSDGFVKPLLLYIVELCIREGMEQVVIVVGPSDVERVRELFTEPEAGLAKAISKKKHIAAYAKKIAELGEKIKLVVQDTPEGFGTYISRREEGMFVSSCVSLGVDFVSNLFCVFPVLTAGSCLRASTLLGLLFQGMRSQGPLPT